MIKCIGGKVIPNCECCGKRMVNCLVADCMFGMELSEETQREWKMDVRFLRSCTMACNGGEAMEKGTQATVTCHKCDTEMVSLPNRMTCDVYYTCPKCSNSVRLKLTNVNGYVRRALVFVSNLFVDMEM